MSRTAALAPLDLTPVATPADRARALGALEAWLGESESALRKGQTRETQAKKGQFFTPWPIARQMAAMMGPQPEVVRLLDPGAGFGILTAAAVAEICERGGNTRRVEVVAVELDPRCHAALAKTLVLAGQLCESHGIEWAAVLERADFLELGSRWRGETLHFDRRSFNLVISNPPYRKIRADSAERGWLRTSRIEASNLYAGFLALAVELLDSGGELVAITPRSFCNGAYFLPFRRLLVEQGRFRRIHLFERRNSAFERDNVLQENLIFTFQRRREPAAIDMTISRDTSSLVSSRFQLASHQLIGPGDPNLFIHLPLEPDETAVADQMANLPARLEQLGLDVSTGRVVEFRCGEFLRDRPQNGTVPLIFPGHLKQGKVQWPLASPRPQHFVRSEESERLLLPAGTYVLVRRLTAKEEKRRVVPALLECKVPLALENHLNFYHRRGRGLPESLAAGLFAYLSSTLVERYFRRFNGHTQVNATDLRSLRYPSEAQLCRLGKLVNQDSDPAGIDAAVGQVVAR